ncbi:MAG TPA: NUDIX hydrolase [Gammaproteobacteria bacterium]|nr:NUDIX hydrolase [Gammaproteobacteria bacterium]
MGDERWRPYATVAAIIEQNQRYLFVEEYLNSKPVLTQPAGHLEKGESLVDAVKREVFEETGWYFEATHLVKIYRYYDPVKERAMLRTTFTGKVLDHDPHAKLDDGIIGTHWLNYEEFMKLESQHRGSIVKRSLDDYLAGHRHSLSVLADL